MGKKAVYNNKMLAIYISGEDFEELLKRGRILAPVFIGKDETVLGQLRVDLGFLSKGTLKRALTLEQAAIDEVRDQFKKSQPISKADHDKLIRS